MAIPLYMNFQGCELKRRKCTQNIFSFESLIKFSWLPVPPGLFCWIFLDCAHPGIMQKPFVREK